MQNVPCESEGLVASASEPETVADGPSRPMSRRQRRMTQTQSLLAPSRDNVRSMFQEAVSHPFVPRLWDRQVIAFMQSMSQENPRTYRVAVLQSLRNGYSYTRLDHSGRLKERSFRLLGKRPGATAFRRQEEASVRDPPISARGYKLDYYALLYVYLELSADNEETFVLQSFLRFCDACQADTPPSLPPPPARRRTFSGYSLSTASTVQSPTSPTKARSAEGVGDGECEGVEEEEEGDKTQVAMDSGEDRAEAEMDGAGAEAGTGSVGKRVWLYIRQKRASPPIPVPSRWLIPNHYRRRHNSASHGSYSAM